MSADPIDWLKDFLRPGGEPKRFGKFELLSVIGRGASGVVYKAVAPDLPSPVALKLLREGARVGREAAAAARLKHPNIVPLIETGPGFLAMDYVDGRSFAETAGLLAPEERLDLLLAVARAVAYAHENGVVHRDLKPENILVEGRHAWLTDFGLAKVAGEKDLTRTGTLLGTPHYMSPELVRGRARETGPATDVWSLGVLLYAAVAGRRPFEGATVFEVYERVVSQDPPAPCPGGLGTVILKAIERDPSARYPDAVELAADLERALKGEPVGARAPGLARRAWRKARKNPAAWALGAVLLAALGVFGLAWRAERERGVAAFREQARVAVDAALALRREGAHARMRRFLPPLEEAHREVSSRAPGLPEPDYLLGRMYRALMDDARALDCQERALRKDPSYGPALYERVVLTFRGYAEDESPRRRESMMRDCAALLSASPGELGLARELVARAIVARCRGESDPARALLERASREDPLLDEIWLVLGVAARLDGASTVEERERSFRAEEASYTSGLERDRGYLPYLLSRGRLRIARAHYAAEHGRDPAADFAAGEADLSEALEKDPAFHDARLRRGIGRLYGGVYGTRPLDDFRRAEEDFDALTSTPLGADAWRMKGSLRFFLGKRRAAAGEDPEPDFAAAQAAFARARDVARNAAGVAETDAHLGRLLIERARTGREPGPLLAEAERLLTRALEAIPENPWYLLLRAGSRAVQAERADDPFSAYALAEDDLDRVIRARKDMTSAWRERARIRSGRGDAWERRGEKARARQDYAAAARDGLETLALNPSLEKELGSLLVKARRKAAELED